MMAEPFIFIGTYTVKEGKLEDFKQHFQEFCAFIEENEPRLIHFALYISEDGTEVSVLQVHPDEDSMAFHMQVAGEHFAQAYEFLDATKSIQIYGKTSGALVEQMKQASSPEVAVIVKSELTGFNRLPATGVCEPAS
jgi:quinol monooxygenase YgiN